MADIDKNYKLRGLYFEISRNPQGVRDILKPVEISVSPEEVLCITQIKAVDPEAADHLVVLEQESSFDMIKSSLIDIRRAKAMIQSVIKENMVFSFVPIKSGGMTPENWEQVRKRQLLKITNPQDNIQTPVIWINPRPELLNTPRFVYCDKVHLHFPTRWDWNRDRPKECQLVETNLIFPKEEYTGVKKTIIQTSWVNRDLADTAYSALKNPLCQKSPYYSLYFKGCEHEIDISRKNEFYESAMKEIFQGRRTQNEHYVKLPGYYDALHLSNIREIRWKKINGLFYITIRITSNGFTKIYWKKSFQFVKKMKKTDDTIEKWMETSGIKTRFFRKINEYTYINRHGGREKDEKSGSAA